MLKTSAKYLQIEAFALTKYFPSFAIHIGLQLRIDVWLS